MIKTRETDLYPPINILSGGSGLMSFKIRGGGAADGRGRTGGRAAGVVETERSAFSLKLCSIQC